MKRVVILAAVVIFLVTGVIPFTSQVYAQSPRKVLMIIREGHSAEPDLMIKMEVGTMILLLKEAGFGVDVASLSGQGVSGCTQKIEKLLRLSEVKLGDYVGVIIPCMAITEAIASPEMVTTVKDVLAKGKVIAASNGGVTVLAKTGALKGRKFAFGRDPSYPQFKDYFAATDLESAIYSGQGVVQDGKIITSGGCPSSEVNHGFQNRTFELTQTFIAAIGK